MNIDPQDGYLCESGMPSEFWDLIYDDLHHFAHRMMGAEKTGHTLQPTALVNEAFLRMVDQKNQNWQNRTHFFAISARIMRGILVDHARSKARKKCGGSWQRVSISESNQAEAGALVNLLSLDEALKNLAELSERMVRVVEMRVFAGMKMAEVARTLGVSKRTVGEDWLVAKKWLTRELDGDQK